MHENVLPAQCLELLSHHERAGHPALLGWTLAGGTGLALQLGHRTSEDLVLFRLDAMDRSGLHDALRGRGPYETLQEEVHTLTVLQEGTKMSFFQVRDPFLFEGSPYRQFRLADIRDIALLKLAAVSGRGARRDFIDLHTILRDDPPLRRFFDWLPEKYGVERLNLYHVLKSLTFFEDAEREPMPNMLVPFNWEECKAFFSREARAILLP